MSTHGEPARMTAPVTGHVSKETSVRVGVAPSLAVVLAMLTLFGPVAMDLYLPVLPSLAADLQSSTSAAQLTMTTCLLGLAAGQVVAGPVSDRYGRRGPLLVGVVVFVVTSVLCALSTSIVMLVAVRFVQGLAGAVGLVIAQAAGRDLYEGAKLTRYYGRIVVLSGLAAVVAPVAGGQLAAVLDWRGFFYLLAGVGMVILAAAVFAFPETLPVAARTRGGAAGTAGHVGTLLRDRVFVGATVSSSLTSAAYFAYLGAAAFVLQDVYALQPSAFSWVFGANALAFATSGFLAGRASERWSEHAVFAVGLWIVTAAAVLLLAAAALELPLAATVAAFAGIAAGAAVVSPPSTSLALVGYPQFAGTASAVLGLARFSAGAAAAPLVGLGGSEDMLPLGVVAVISSLGAVAVYRFLIRIDAVKACGRRRAPSPVATIVEGQVDRTLRGAGLLFDPYDEETARGWPRNRHRTR